MVSHSYLLRPPPPPRAPPPADCMLVLPRSAWARVLPPLSYPPKALELVPRCCWPYPRSAVAGRACAVLPGVRLPLAEPAPAFGLWVLFPTFALVFCWVRFFEPTLLVLPPVLIFTVLPPLLTVLPLTLVLRL